MSTKKRGTTPSTSPKVSAPKVVQKRTPRPSSATSKLAQKRIPKTSSASKIVQKRTPKPSSLPKSSSTPKISKEITPPPDQKIGQKEDASTLVEKEDGNITKKTTGGKKRRPQDPFLRFWIKFYNQALALTSSQYDTDSLFEDKDSKSTTTSDSIIDPDRHNKRVLVILDSIIKLIFGLDGEKKAQAVAYGGGALELIVELVRSTGVLSSSSNSPTTDTAKKETEFDRTQRHSIIFTSVKAIKSCVVRNPAGRWRCRSAGVFSFLDDTLDQLMVVANAVLVEEVFTTLAAICLGNDLNALQGSSQMDKYLTPAIELYPDQREMLQKILYIRTLFDAVRGEQSKILQWFQEQESQDEKDIFSSAESSFFQEVIEAEVQLRSKTSLSPESNSKELVERYNQAVIQLQKYQHLTGLVSSIIVDLRYKRAVALLRNGDAEECLEDTRFLLEENADASTSKIRGLKLHSKALIQLGRLKEAGDCLGKLKILCGEDKEIISLLEKVNI